MLIQIFIIAGRAQKYKKDRTFCLLTKLVQNREYKHFHVHNSNYFRETSNKVPLTRK